MKCQKSRYQKFDITRELDEGKKLDVVRRQVREIFNQAVLSAHNSVVVVSVILCLQMALAIISRMYSKSSYLEIYVAKSCTGIVQNTPKISQYVLGEKKKYLSVTSYHHLGR